jgi:hypothetical protein
VVLDLIKKFKIEKKGNMSRWGWEVHALRGVVILRSSAARAAHRELCSLLRLFLANNA